MPLQLIRGEPGTTWTNDTGKILWQATCHFERSCARCIALHHAIGPYFPFPLHDLCNCTQHPIKPGQAAAPFIDYQAAVAALPPSARAHAMGASNWRLVASGLAKWEDVVTPGRIRDFREVVDRLGLSVDRMIEAGVSPLQARRAYDATHTKAHGEASAARDALIQGLKNHGLSDARVAAEVGDLLARRVVASGPGGTDRFGPTPPPGPAPVPTPARPRPPAPASPAAARPATRADVASGPGRPLFSLFRSAADALRAIGRYLGARFKPGDDS